MDHKVARFNARPFRDDFCCCPMVHRTLTDLQIVSSPQQLLMAHKMGFGNDSHSHGFVREAIREHARMELKKRVWMRFTEPVQCALGVEEKMDTSPVFRAFFKAGEQQAALFLENVRFEHAAPRRR